MVTLDFKYSLLQAVAVFAEGAPSTQKLIAKFFPKVAAIFSGEPTILPIPKDAPPEIPRIILTSEDKLWELVVSNANLVVSWKRLAKVSASPNLKEFYEKSVAVIGDFAEETSAPINRAGAIIHRFTLMENPGGFLASHFCKPDFVKAPFNRPENFELHAHKRYAFPNRRNVNSWVRNKTGRLNTEHEKDPILLIEQDINTLQEDAAAGNLSYEEVDAFFTNVNTEADKILKLYYPSWNS